MNTKKPPRRTYFIWTADSEAEAQRLQEALRFYGCAVDLLDKSIYAAPKKVADAFIEGYREGRGKTA